MHCTEELETRVPISELVLIQTVDYGNAIELTDKERPDPYGHAGHSVPTPPEKYWFRDLGP